MDQPKKQTKRTLREYAEANGVTCEDLDDLVHDVASKIASDINNNGVGDQCDWLFEELGKAGAFSELTRVIVEKQKPPTGDADGNG